MWIGIEVWDFFLRLFIRRTEVYLVRLQTTYNGEFDPGSGWTLAAGLTHASRGVTLQLAVDDDRRTGE